MYYYNEIKEYLLKCEIYDKTKDYLKEQNKVNVYFKIGGLLNNAKKEYGKNIIKQYSEKLVIEIGKKYNIRTLYNMRKFYEIFSNEKLNPLGSKLSWSHYRELLVVKDIEAIIYYIHISEKNNLTKRELKEKIKRKEYDRLDKDTKIKLNNKETLKISETIPNPIFINNNLLEQNMTEYALRQSIINNIDGFIKELGYGFCYIGNEYKIKLGDTYNYIDLLLFNYYYNCFVVIELKVTELKKEHIGQVEVYMNYIDNNIKRIEHDKTIGIIICKKNNKYIIEYSSDSRIISREYTTI